jgi:hypothetical protein
MSLKLIVDGNDNYRDAEDVFYIHPSRLGKLKHVQNNSFESCQIKNSPLETFTPLNLVCIRDTLVPNGKMEIELDQPLSVMHDYDAKQFESNAKFAGFDDVQIDGTSIVCTKPEKRKANIEVETTTVTKTSATKGGKTTTTTTTTTTSSSRRRGKK